MTTRTVSFSIEAKVASAVAGLNSVERAARGAMVALDDSAKRRHALTELGNTAGKLGITTAAGLGTAVKAAMDWESAWAGVNKTVDGSASQMAQLEGELRGLARSMPASHQEIAATAEAAGQLGVAREDISSFTKTMLMLGETTNLSADEAATSIAQMANVMGTAPQEVERVGAALVALGNDGASTEAQILGMAQRIAGAGAQIGLAESDILAIANAAASMGIEVEAGGTAISRVFTDMAKATAQGGQDLEQFAQIAGVSAEQFQRLFTESPAQAFEAFTSGLDRIKESGGDVFTALENIGLSDVRVSQALLGMAASGDLLSDSLQLGASAFNSNSALADEYAKRAETSAARVQVAWNQLKDASIEVGAAALPIFADVASGAGQAASAFGQLPGPVQETTAAMLGLTAVTGGGLWLGTKVISGISATKEALDTLNISAGRTGTALSRAGRAAGVAGGLFAGLMVVDTLQSGMDDYAVSVEDMARSLDLLADVGAKNFGNRENLEGLADSIERLANPNMMQALQDNVSDSIGGIGGGSELREARGQIEALDGALASMVSNGNAKAAARALQELDLSDAQMGDLLTLLPQYESALAGLEASAAGAGRALRSMLVPGLRETGDAFGDAAGQGRSFAGVLKSIEGFLDKRAALRNYQQALDDLAASLKENGRSFDRNTAKGRANEQSLDDVASAALQVASHMKRADKVEFLKGTSKDILRAMGNMKDLPPSVQRIIDKLRQADKTKAEPTVKPKGVEDTKKKLNDVDRDFRGIDRLMGGPTVKPKNVPGTHKDLTGVEQHHRKVDQLNGGPLVKPDNIPGSHRDLDSVQSHVRDVDNDRANPQINVNPGNSLGVIGAVRAGLAGIQSKTVNVHVTRSGFRGQPGFQVADGGIFDRGRAGLIQAYADGGTFAPRYAGTLGARQPGILPYAGPGGIIMNEEGSGPWEGIVSGHPAKRGRSRMVMDELAARLGGEIAWYADGGIRGRGGRGDTSTMGRLERAVRAGNEDRRRGNKDRRDGNRDAKKSRESRKKDLQRQAKQLDKMLEQSNQLNQQVQQNFRADPFGQNFTLQGVMASLEADTARAGDFRAAARTAKKLGLDGGVFRALLASGNTAVLADIDSRSEVRAIEKAWAQRNRATADLTFGAATSGRWEGQTVAQLESTLRRLEREIKQIGKRVEGGARNGSRQGTREGADRDRRRRTRETSKGKRP